MDIPIPPIIFIFSFLVSLILFFFTPIYKFESIYILSLIFIVIGIFLAVYSSYTIIINKTTINPNETPSILIKNGPFKISRNPIYLSMLIILFGLDFYFFAIISFINIIIFFLIINFFIIPKEEKNIEKKFGDTYIEYKRKVRRWI
jgi:protein-S-isoprenylcysteine O-methyltransferase Ste14